MNSINLNSELFERAAISLSHSLDNFNRDQSIEGAVSQFAASVDKLQILMGMQAENDYRKACGHQVTYVENDFHNI